jgi:DNA-binding response OmpR family regulator
MHAEDHALTEQAVPDGFPKNIAVIDDDQLVRNLVTNYCRSIGILEIETYESADKAWDAMVGGKIFDLVILDWKLPGLTGVGLFNRMRSHKNFKTVPMLVISGFLNQNDFALLEEFPCTSLLEKPFTKILLERKIRDLTEESKWYEEKYTMVEELLSRIDVQGSAAIKELRKVCAKSPRPIPLSILIAKRLREANFLADAKSFLELALQHDTTSVSGMTEMAKVLFQMGQIEKARDVLRISNRISPENVSRLCFMGEVELNLSDPDAARKYFEDALEIDPQDPTAQSGVTVANAIAEHVVNYSRESIPNNFASLLNIVAITKVRSGNFEAGINQYIAALAFLRSDLAVAKISFNLGLGFLRWQKPELARKWFEKSSSLGNGKFGRAQGYLDPSTSKVSRVPSAVVPGYPANEDEGDLFEVSVME